MPRRVPRRRPCALRGHLSIRPAPPPFTGSRFVCVSAVLRPVFSYSSGRRPARPSAAAAAAAAAPVRARRPRSRHGSGRGCASSAWPLHRRPTYFATAHELGRPRPAAGTRRCKSIRAYTLHLYAIYALRQRHACARFVQDQIREISGYSMHHRGSAERRESVYCLPTLRPARHYVKIDQDDR